MNNRYNLILGDCIEKMRELPAASVDAVVCDPPYGLEFMGKEWDSWDRRDHLEESKVNEGVGTFLRASKNLSKYTAGQSFQDWCGKWASEALRVLKPGGFMFAMGGTRTHHRLTCGIEDAGFLIRDELCWVYLQGFPKAQALDALIDKKNVIIDDDRKGLMQYLKSSREKKGMSSNDVAKNFPSATGGITGCVWNWENGLNIPTEAQWAKLKDVLGLDCRYDKLVSDEEKRRRFEEKRDVVGEYQTDMGGLGGERLGNIGGNITVSKTPAAKAWQGWKTPALKPAFEPIVVAQKPCEGSITENVMTHGVGGYNIDACRIPYEHEEDKEKGWRASPSNDEKNTYTSFKTGSFGEQNENGRYPSNLMMTEPCFKGDSKFFLIPKASKGEKTEGLDEEIEQNHPTVKPVLLMEHLIKLTTTNHATVLDPFMGSGTTGVAALNLNRKFLGMEIDAGYFKIAKKRISEAAKQTKLM